jgi:hypothetical protein
MFSWFLPLVLMAFFTGCVTFSENKVYPIGNDDFKVEVDYYPSPNSKKSLLILPPTGGPNYVDRSYAKEFQNQGFDVYILNQWTGDKESRIDLDIHQSLYTRAQKAIGLVIDQIKTPYIGMLGTSVGALHASVAASVQDRLNSVFIITGGAPVTEIIVRSDQRAMIDSKEKRFQKYSFKNESEYIQRLKKEFHLEPMELGEKFKNKTLGMVIAEEDTTVPTNNQRQLQKYWNPKTTIVYQSSHFWGIVKTWLFESKAVFGFFEEDARRVLLGIK